MQKKFYFEKIQHSGALSRIEDVLSGSTSSIAFIIAGSDSG